MTVISASQAFLYITYAFFTVLLWFRFRGPLRRFGGDTFLVLRGPAGSHPC